jgi:hypothetical protein
MPSSGSGAASSELAVAPSLDFLVEVDEGKYASGNQVPMRVFTKLLNGASREDHAVTFQIKMHRWNEPQDLDNDPVQESTTGETDANGIYDVYWSPDTALSRATDKFAYYAYAYLTDSPSVKATSASFYVLDKRMYTKYDAVQPLLPLQRIPVYNERSRNLDGGLEFPFTYGNWNGSPVPTFYSRVGDTIADVEPASINYDSGLVTTATSMTAGSELFGDYTFRFFTDDQILSSLDDAVQWMNAFARKEYTTSNFPDFWNPFVKAYIVNDLIEAVWSSLLFREKRLIFADDDVTSNLQSIFQANSTMLEDAKKRARKPGDFTPRVLTGGDVVFPFRNTSGAYWIYSAAGVHR